MKLFDHLSSLFGRKQALVAAGPARLPVDPSQECKRMDMVSDIGPRGLGTAGDSVKSVAATGELGLTPDQMKRLQKHAENFMRHKK